MWYRGGDARAAAALMFLCGVTGVAAQVKPLRLKTFLLVSRFLNRVDFLSTLASAVSFTASEKFKDHLICISVPIFLGGNCSR